MTPELFERLAARFGLLADAKRLRLLHRLKGGEARVGDLARGLDLAQPTVSKHLGALRQAGLVSCRRDGTEAWYAIRDRSLFRLCELVCDAVESHLREELGAVAGPRRRS